ncbi:putative polyprotein [Myrmica rubra picorna-like virus 2]|nr:putative polyprotein [Myrmica rubra picorna-like virus 2]
MSTQVTCGSLLSTRAELQHSNTFYDALDQLPKSKLTSELLGDHQPSDFTCRENDTRFSKFTVTDIPKLTPPPPNTKGHISNMMDKVSSLYTSAPTMHEMWDSILHRLSTIRETLQTFSKEVIIANILKGSDPFTRLAFSSAIDSHPYLSSLNSEEKVSTMKIILHTINVAILLINLVVMFSTASSKSVVALQVASIICSITLFLTEIYSNCKLRSLQNFNIEEMLHDLLSSKLESQFVSKYDSRRDQIVCELFTNYGKKFNLPDAVLNVARDKLSQANSEIILCPETSQYFDYAINVAEKTGALLDKYPGLRDANIITRAKFDFGMGDGLHQAFSHFKCIQALHPDTIKELDLMESDFGYWNLVVKTIKLSTPYKNFTMEGFPTLDNKYGTLGEKTFNIFSSQFDSETTMFPHIGKAACALLALVGAGLATFTGKNHFTNLFKKAKSFIKDWKDSKSLITGFKAAFIGIVYEMFGWDIGNIHALKKHAKEISLTLTKCSTVSHHTISANPILKKKMESYQNEALQVLEELSKLDLEDNKEMIRDLKILNSTVSKILAESHVVDDRASFRVIPVALYLCGHAGSGKTHFILHLLSAYLKSKLNMSAPCKFTVDASGHWNLQNPDQADHLFTDELGSKLDDPQVSSLNELISEGIFHAPGAYVKDITLAPKLVSFCNNEDEVKNQSTTQAFATAMASRLTQYKVVHNDFDPNGSQSRDSLTRLDDMSNVRFYPVKRDLQGRKIETSQYFSALEVCEQVYQQIVKHEENYQKLQAKYIPDACTTRGPFSFSLLDYVQNNTNYKTYVKKNMNFLFSLTDKFHDSSDLYPLSHFLKTQICIHLDGEFQKIGTGTDKLCCEQIDRDGQVDFLCNKHLYVSQIDSGKRITDKETLFLHVIGEPGVGKSHMIREKVIDLHVSTGYPFYYVTGASLDFTKKDIVAEKSPIIIVLDDVISLKPADFQGLYDHIPKGSICIMLSNLKFEDASRWEKFRYGKIELKRVILDNDFGPSVGWYRRLNLPFSVIGCGMAHEPNYNTTIIYKTCLEDVESQQAWEKFLTRDFFNHIIRPATNVIKHHYSVPKSEMPKRSQEVYIRYSSENSFKSIMSSAKNSSWSFAAALKGLHPNLKVVAKNLPTPKDIDSVRFHYYSSEMSVESYLQSLFPIFQKIFPNAKGATLEIANSIVATLENGSIYTTAANPNIRAEIEAQSHGFFVRKNNLTDFFSTEEALDLVTADLTELEPITRSHPSWSILTLLCDKEQLRERFISFGLINNDTFSVDLADPVISKFKEIINSTRFKVFCGIFVTIFALITVTSLVNLSYALYKLFKGEKRDVEIEGKDVFVYDLAHETQANDWFDDIEEDILAGRHPKDKPYTRPNSYDDLEIVTSVAGKTQLEKEEYEDAKKVKRNTVAKRYGFTGRMVQANPVQDVKIKTDAKQEKAKRVNNYVSQMINFRTSTNQTPINDFRANKIVEAQCRCESEEGKLLGCFVGGKYVITCAHIMKPEAFERGAKVTVYELIDGIETAWEATPIYHGFKRSFKNKTTDLLVAFIDNPKFQSKPNLIKYFKTVQDFVDHQNNKDILKTSVCYLSDNDLHRELNLETKIADTTVSTFNQKGELELFFNSPLMSHELSSNRGESNLYNDTFVPGSCGLVVYCRETPSGNGWICGMHAALNKFNREVEAFPLYKDHLEYIIQKHTLARNGIRALDTSDFDGSFIANGLELPTGVSCKKLFCLSPTEIVCLDCMAKMNQNTYQHHECYLHQAQSNPIADIKYELNGEVLSCDVPEWWQEVLAELIPTPRTLPDCAILDNKIVNTPELKYMGRSWFKMPGNIKPRYSLAPYATRMPYKLLKRPAILHPKQVSKEYLHKIDNTYDVEYKDDLVIKIRENGKNIESSQIRLMTGGQTDASCKNFFGERILKEADRLFSLKFQEVVKHDHPQLQPRLLTDDEVINGITNQNHPLSKHVYNMDLDSEAGPTANLLFPNFKGLKRDHFQQDGKNRDGSDRFILNSKASKYWYRVRDNAKKGIVTFAPDHLKKKNENLKIEKVLEGKTRAYISRDLWGMMLEKKVFGFIQGLFHMDGCDHFSAIGANPQEDFQKLLQRFKDLGCDNIICYDVSRWDKNTLRILLERTLMTILNYLKANFNISDQMENMMRVVFASVLSTYFITGADFYFNGRSMPSGTYLTALINTCLNEYCLCLLVAHLAAQEKLNSDKIMKQIASVFMGDDGVIGFPQTLVKFFEPVRLQHIYKQMNIELTSTTKDGSDIGIVSLMDFEFCSRTVKLHKLDGRYVTCFPLKEISVMSDSHWVTKNTPETKLSICRTKLQEACLHGEEFYKQEVECVKIILSTLAKDHANEILILSWQDQLRAVLFSASTEDKESYKDIHTYKSQALPKATPQLQNMSTKNKSTTFTLDEIDVLFDVDQLDYISKTQEICQHRKIPVPEYYFSRVKNTPDNAPVFKCSGILEHKDGDKESVEYTAIGKKAAKMAVAKEFYKILSNTQTAQMERSVKPFAPAQSASQSSTSARPTASQSGTSNVAASAAGDAPFDPMITTTTAATISEIVQPSIEQLECLVNYGDPREWYDAVKTQQFPVRDIIFNAAAAKGNIIMKIPYGFDHFPTPCTEYIVKHKYFKGTFKHSLVLYSNATITGAIRISHVKDIDQDVYTLNQLIETNHSEIVQLNAISTTSNLERSFEIDYAGVADKVLPVKEVLDGTYKWNPSRPGLVVTMEVPVQQIYGQNLNLTIQHYAEWGLGLVCSTPLITPQTDPIQPGNRTMLEAMQGMSLNTVISGLEPGLQTTDIELTTDGNSYPATIFTPTREYQHQGIKFGQEADIEFRACTGIMIGDTPKFWDKTSKVSNAIINSKHLTANAGTIYCRLFLIEGDAPINMDWIEDVNGIEKALATGWRVMGDQPTDFPIPDKDFVNTDSTIAQIQQTLLEKYNERINISLQTFNALPFKFTKLESNSYEYKRAKGEMYYNKVDLTKRAHNVNCKALYVNIGQLAFRLYILDVDVTLEAGDWMITDELYAGQIIDDIFTMEYTPPTTGVTTVPLISTWKNFSKLPNSLKVLSLRNPQTSALVTPNGNEGLSTIVDVKYTAAFLTFLDVNTPEGRVAKITLMQSGTGRVVANVYYSKEYKQMFIDGTSGTMYASFLGQPSSSYVISSVTFQSPSEAFTKTDDTAWSTRAVNPPARNIYRSQMMLAAALGSSAIGGMFQGVSQTINTAQQLKQEKLLQQQRLDFQNSWNKLSSQTQLRTNEITNATNQSISTGNNLSNQTIASGNNATSLDIALGQNANRLEVAGIQRDVSLAGMKNQMEIANLGAQTQLGTKQIDKLIAAGNNATTLQASEIAADASRFGNALGLTGSVINSGVGLAKVASDYLQGDKNRENVLESIHVRGNEDRQTIDHRAMLAGANIASSQ